MKNERKPCVAELRDSVPEGAPLPPDVLEKIRRCTRAPVRGGELSYLKTAKERAS